MNTRRLLTFLWCGKEYGVAVEDVLGISHCCLNTSQELSLWERQEVGNRNTDLSKQNNINKQVLLLNKDGVQISLLVDEIIAIADFDRVTLSEKRATDLKIWSLLQLKQPVPENKDADV